MKASFFMFFNYLAMMGVPVLLVVLAVCALLVPGRGALQDVLLALIAAGAVVYGAIGIREAYVHGKGKHESARR